MSNYHFMSHIDRQDPRTAAAEHSIWRDTPEDDFRQQLVRLEQRTNAVVTQPHVYHLTPHSPSLPIETRLLPLDIEQKLADDFAYIAAVGEGAQSVSAVCIEEYSDPPQIIIRFASVDVFNQDLQYALQEVVDVLARCTSSDAPRTATYAHSANVLLRLIVKKHYQKLMGRLRSVKWQKPNYLSRTHKKSLLQDLDNLVHRVQFVYPKRKDSRRDLIAFLSRFLGTVIQEFENRPTGSDSELTQLIQVVEESYKYCHHSDVRDFAAKLGQIPLPTPQVAAAIKTLHQIEKIGAYKRISLDLVDTAVRYPVLFKNPQIRYVRPYKAVETKIGHETWAKTMHVHAEIQLVVHYDLPSSGAPFHRPRVIGTSKYLCHLCFEFISQHGLFFPASTHGRLYDQWTIPDRADFDEGMVQKYRQIIARINSAIIQMSDEIGPQEGKRDVWRVEPMTSRQNLLLEL